jgi:hypothetical protein
MKKLVILLLCISTTIFAQIPFRCIIVEWNDTVTVRDVTNINSYRIVNNNYMTYSLPVQGIASNLEAFVYKQFSEIPPVDYRLYNVLIQESCLDSIDQMWSPHRIYARQFSIIERDTIELFQSVEQEENLANAGVFPYEKQLKYIALYLGILDRKIDGLSIPQKLQVLKPKMDAKIELIYQNYVNSLNKKQAISDEENFDIDLGWNSSDPE